jgi:hypothetical protein
MRKEKVTSQLANMLGCSSTHREIRERAGDMEPGGAGERPEQQLPYHNVPERAALVLTVLGKPHEVLRHLGLCNGSWAGEMKPIN